MTKRAGRILNSPGFYVVLLAIAAVGTIVYELRTDGIFACSSQEYEAGRYLAYCNSAGFSDYDHGAFWFNLEPRAVSMAAGADVLFLGTSRVQFALSSETTREWFADAGASFYLLGFAYSENMTFTGPLLDRLSPAARVYVINTDRFFRQELTAPASEIFEGDAPESRSRRKRLWQIPHSFACDRLSILCGNRAAFLRDRKDGIWTLQGSDGLEPDAISWAEAPSEEELQSLIRSAASFVDELPVPRECVILTVAPTTATPRDEAAGIARALDLPFIAPRGEDLRTFDGSHLDRHSAESWSGKFLDAASERILGCLERSGGAEDALNPSAV